MPAEIVFPARFVLLKDASARCIWGVEAAGRGVTADGVALTPAEMSKGAFKDCAVHAGFFMAKRQTVRQPQP